MFLLRASALFYRAPRGFALFQTWTRDKICSGAAPDWLRRQSRRVSVCLNKKKVSVVLVSARGAAAELVGVKGLCWLMVNTLRFRQTPNRVEVIVQNICAAVE